MFTHGETLDLLLRLALLGPIALGIVIIYVRIIGLRSFSKMTAFDFVVTVAVGSLLASAATSSGWSNFIQSIGAIGTLLLFQAALALIIRKSDKLSGYIENQPVLLFYEGEWKQDQLTKTRTSKDNILAKMREANITCFSQVRAVVLETTGDVSVLHDDKLDNDLLKGVR
jgi:uncharacterized membrane protein YcaP (DUF421 family)